MYLWITILILFGLALFGVFMYSACRLASECDAEDERLFQQYLITHVEEADA